MISIRYKALIPAGVLGGVLIAMALAASVAIEKLNDTNTSLAERYEEIEAVRLIELSVNRLVYPLVAGTAKKPTELQNDFANHINQIRTAAHSLRSMKPVHVNERELLDAVEERLDGIESTLQHAIAVPNNFSEQAINIIENLSSQHLSPLNDLLHTWHSAELAQVTNLQRQSREISDAFLYWAVFFASVGGGVLVFSLWLNNRILLTPLIKISRTTSKIAAGEALPPLALENNDELGQLAIDINNMGENLRRVHCRLENLANTDALTGLHNRRAYELTILRELEAARRYRRKFALCILDLDNFKEINDKYGHKTGDEVLRFVANLTATTLRQSDHLFRFGGEEFIILLQEADQRSARSSLDRCRINLQKSTCHIDDIEIKITVSIGAACFPGDADNADDLLGLADAALYSAKHDGRNRAYIYDQTIRAKQNITIPNEAS